MRERRNFFVVLVLSIAVACAVVAPSPAQAQDRVRVVTKNAITGEVTKTSEMNIDMAIVVAMAAATSSRPLSCWLERDRKFWFFPIRAEHIPIVTVRLVTPSGSGKSTARK